MNNVQQGWQCPVCKCVYAPWVQACDKCRRDIESKEAAMNFVIEQTKQPTLPEQWVWSDMKCDNCGGNLDLNVAYVSDVIPPDREYRCKKCGRFRYITVTHL